MVRGGEDFKVGIKMDYRVVTREYFNEFKVGRLAQEKQGENQGVQSPKFPGELRKKVKGGFLVKGGVHSIFQGILQ